jgi:hypothetical protein
MGLSKTLRRERFRLSNNGVNAYHFVELIYYRIICIYCIFRESIYKIIKGLWNIRSEIYGMNLPDEYCISVYFQILTVKPRRRRK